MKNYFLRIILSVLIVIMLIAISKNYFQRQYMDEISDSISQVIDILEESQNIDSEVQDEISENIIERLQRENNNSDIKATLSIENSSFLEPVVQTSDNEYYLTHDNTKRPNKLGAIYADYRVNLDTSRKILIFGHSSTKNNAPFNYLENYYDEEYYHNHRYITLETKTNIYRYEIFSVYIETNDFTYMNMNFDNDEEWYLHILKLQEKSLYKTNVKLTENEDILILQTCSNHPNYQKYSKKYLLIVSRRV